jgi:hypothetical protein
MSATTRTFTEVLRLSDSVDAYLNFAADPVPTKDRVFVNGHVGQPQGRFTTEFELDGIFRGMRDDLQRRVGMQVQWSIWDPQATEVDDIYSVGSRGVGRRWKAPFEVPVIVAQVFQGQSIQNERGFYNADVLRLTVSMDDVNRFLPTLVDSPDIHILDRVLYRGSVFSPTRLYLRGQVLTSYTVLTIDLNQVKSEEMVNDDQFKGFAS